MPLPDGSGIRQQNLESKMARSKMPQSAPRLSDFSLLHGETREKISFPTENRAAGAGKPFDIKGLRTISRRCPAGKIASLLAAWQGNSRETTIAKMLIRELTRQPKTGYEVRNLSLQA
jgi:hypothetical protein